MTAQANVKASDIQVGGDHYRQYAIQPSEFCQRNGFGWCESNAIKYVARHRNKNGRQDIEKAIHYLQLLLEWEYVTESESPALADIFRRCGATDDPCATCLDEKQCGGGLQMTNGKCLHHRGGVMIVLTDAELAAAKALGIDKIHEYFMAKEKEGR